MTVRDRLPPELGFSSSTDGGVPGAGEVVWNLGTLAPKAEKRIRISARCEQLSKMAVNQAVASADPGVTANASAALEVLGLPALQLEVTDVGDPVEVSKHVTYQIKVTNTGSLPVSQVARPT